MEGRLEVFLLLPSFEMSLRSSSLAYYAYFKSLRTFSGSCMLIYLEAWKSEREPPLLIVDIFVRSGFLTRVYFSRPI